MVQYHVKTIREHAEMVWHHAEMMQEHAKKTWEHAEMVQEQVEITTTWKNALKRYSQFILMHVSFASIDVLPQQYCPASARAHYLKTIDQHVIIDKMQ